MSVELKNLENLVRMENIFNSMLNNAMKKLVADVMLEIIRLTNKGMNAYNKPFLPYSKSYQAERVKSGRNAKPNMQWTSSMLHSLSVTPLRQTTQIRAYKIGVSGTDINGVANTIKLTKLKHHKNYIILEGSPYYKKLVDKHLKRFLRDFINRVS